MQVVISNGEKNIAKSVLKMVQPDSHEEGRILPAYAASLVEDDPEKAVDLFKRAVAIAQREKDLILESRILIKWLRFDEHREDYLGISRTAKRLIELAKVLHDPQTEADAYLLVCAACMNDGDLDGVREYSTAYLEAAEKLGFHITLKSALQRNMLVCELQGDWKIARSIYGRIHAIDQSNLYSELQIIARIEYQTGNFEVAERYMEVLVKNCKNDLYKKRVMYITPMIARITGNMDYFKIAIEAVPQL